MLAGISLANKCQLLFGFAVVIILTAALSVPWMRTSSLVEEYQMESARQLAEAWLSDRVNMGMVYPSGRLPGPPTELLDGAGEGPSLRVSYVRAAEIDAEDDTIDPFLREAVAHFNDRPEDAEYVETMRGEQGTIYRYARAVRESQMRAMQDRALSIFQGEPFDPDLADPLRALLIVDRTSRFAEQQLLISRVFIVTAGLVGSLLAVLVFYLILTKLIFSPVRQLRRTTEKVEQGDLSIRSELNTGDEFQELSEAFNAMLDRLESGQAQLRSMNESLDLKVNELAEANVGLFEANRFKSEFLANVSHELRTPLNSILGFTELLDELARSDERADPKRMRYLQNILSSGRRLLEMINELLDLAKIEAGRMEVSIEPTSVSDLIEGLAGIMRPQAESNELTLNVEVASNIPMIETDPGKLQQILYNFLSNAIKFTPAGGRVTIGANRVTRQDNSLGVRLSVADTGPGIPPDMQDLIFEKFRQIDSAHTREHPGTGLGLAICKELAQMLGAEVSFVSEQGRGATFYVDLPLTHQPREPEPLMGRASPNGDV